MALTLVVEDGTGKTNANSYATEAQGDSYHDGHLYATAWTGATSANKEAALVMATRLVDDYFIWSGTRKTKEQALEWPRFDMYDRGGFLLDSASLPDLLVNATCELARWLLGEDRTAEADEKGFKKLKVGSLTLEPDLTDRAGVLPDVVKNMLQPFGHPRKGGSTRVVR